MRNLFNRLRCFYIWVKVNVADAVTSCRYCGDRGVVSRSYAPGPLCDSCARAYQKCLDRYGKTVLVNSFVNEYGTVELHRVFGNKNTNPLALKIDALDNIPCDEYEIVEDEVCFDSYPFSVADVEKMIQTTSKV